MKRILTLAIAAIISIMAVNAQVTATSQSWIGTLSIGVQKLDVGFTITPQGCTMDVPEQGAKDIPVVIVKNDADSLSLSIAMLGASYAGRKVSAESIEGVFTQNGYALSLNLKPGAFEIKRPQEPQPPYPYTTEDVVWENKAEGAQLAGTLTYPVNYDSYARGTVPVVLLVSGSGGQDRNEEIFDHKPFLVIADYLARNGIATLRYDDRGVGLSTGPTDGTTTRNNMADAEAGIAYLRSLGKFGKVGVLGHSEGGTIAFMMGANKSVDFIISLAGSSASGMDVIVGQNVAAMQLQGVPVEYVKNYAKALRLLYKDRVERKPIADATQYVEELCKSNNITLPNNFKSNLAQCTTAGGEWFTWFLGYQPAEAISQTVCPVMALNGTLDMQVLSRDNLPVIEENLPHNELSLIKEYDSLNHLFQHCTPATALTYGAIEETIAEEVLTDIVSWIKDITSK